MNATETGVRNALSYLESTFFSALENGTEALAAFDRAWTTFTTQVEACVDQLNEDTKTKIYSFATTANVVTTMLLDVDTAGDNIHRQFQDDVIVLLREEFSTLSIHETAKSLDAQATATYIPLAYKWLLENLHNPYPSKEVRLSISKSTNSSLKDVDAWFIDARKRIGWNQLRKDHFPKRSDLIKAATRFFKPTQTVVSSSNSLKTTIIDSIDYANQFVQIEDRARDLYSSKLFPSNLAADIENMKSWTHLNARRSGEEQSDRERSSSPELDGRTFYPSPEYSPGPSSPSPSPSPGHVERISRKRKQSSALEPLSTIEETASHTSKRSRLNDSQSNAEAAVMSLPSPAASVDDSFAGESSITSIMPSMSIPPSTKRKRALSDADDRVHKRPSNMMAFQRFQTVSDPLPYSIQSVQQADTVSDAWFTEVFGIDLQIIGEMPPPAIDEPLGELSEVEVDVHEFDFASSPIPALSLGGVESPVDSPELADDLILPQLQIPDISNLCGIQGDVFDFNSSSTNDYDFSSSMFGIPGRAFLHPSAANAGDMFSHGWMNDFTSVDNIQPDSLWLVDDLSINSNTFELSDTSGIPFLDSLSAQLPTSLAFDLKSQLIRDELDRKMAEVQVLQAELAQVV